MNKYKKLVSNSIVFAIGNLGSKMIAFLMLPLYTYTLTTRQFGTADLLQTTCNLLLPLVSLNIFEGVLRFAMDKNEDRSKILNVGINVTILGGIVALIVAIIIRAIGVPYAILVAVILISQAVQSLFAQYAKAIGKVRVFAINGILLTFLTAIFDVIFLVFLKFGLLGYLYAIIVATILSDVYLMLAGGISRNPFSFAFDRPLFKRLMQFSAPLIPNSIAWWSTSTLTRYFILFFIGSAANGIFAVANKIPSLLSVISTIFFQSWQISAIEEYDNDQKDDFYSNVFSLYSQVMLLGSAFVIAILKPLMSVLVSPDFFSAWKYIPILLISVVYSSFSSFMGQYYIAAKHTFGVFTTTIYGTVANIVLNFILTPVFHLYGTTLSAMLSYLIIWILRVRATKEYSHTKIDIKNIILNHCVIAIQIGVLFLFAGHISYLIQGVLLIISMLVNRAVLGLVLNGIKSVVNSKLRA